ncbi:MAG: S53 family peptidase [Candidatus Bathyarchaeia archaeon]
MNRLQKSIIIASILTTMLLLASYPVFASVEPTSPTSLQANPFYIIKTAGIDPNAIGPDNPYYTPADIKNAYNLPSTGGTGTIAIVDAYSDPNIASNLATFSSQWGLAAPNLEIHQMSSLITSNSGWGMEESLDVEWAHAIAPNAKILLVEANSASTTDLLSAVSYAASRSDVVAISMSWGTNEFSGEQSYDSYFTSHAGVSFFASAGDTGGAVIWPSSSGNVISVGGTTLTQTATGYTEKAWSSGGGGVSAYEQVPSSQASLGYKYRATPDVAYNADPNTGFLVLDTYGYSGWYAVGGTSAGAPQWAAIQSLGLSVTSNNLYNDYAQPSTYAADFKDITSGSNTVYPASTGYDLATGLGTPLTTNFAPVTTTPNYSLSPSSSSLTIQAGSTGTSTIAATALNGYTGTVSFTVTDPNGWASVNPTSITLPPSGSTTLLSIPVPSTATAGTYTITVSGSDTTGLPIHTTTVTYTVTTPNFSVSASPSSMSIRSGSHSTSSVTIASIGGFTGQVSLTASASGGGLSATLSPSSITSSGSSTLTITVPSSTRSGTFTVTVTGTSGALIHSTTVKVTVSRSF